MIARHAIESDLSDGNAQTTQRVRAACDLAAVVILCLCLVAFLLLAR
jgi:hypothetical protein